MPRRSYSRSRSYDRDRRDRSDDRGYRGGRSGRGGHSRSRSRGYRGPPLNTENQVYVARFSKRVTENDLRKAFERYGYIEKVDLKEFRGFGFIYFENRRDAEDAIEDMNGRTLPGMEERLVVEKAGAGRRARGPRRRSRSREHPLSRIPRGSETACYNCNKEGHFARECRESPQTRRERPPPKGADGRCFICDEKGHKKINCPNRRDKYGGRGKSESFSRSVSRRRSRSRSYSRGKKKQVNSPYQYSSNSDRNSPSRSRSRSRSPKRKAARKYSDSRSPREKSKKYKSKGRDRSPTPKKKRSASRDSRSRDSRSRSRSRSKPEAAGEETDATAITQLQKPSESKQIEKNNGVNSQTIAQQ